MKIVVSGYVGKKITGIGRNLICLLDNVSGDNEYIIYTNEDMKGDFVFHNPKVQVKTYNVSKESSLKNLLWTTFVFPFIVLKEKADKALIPNFTLLLFMFKPTIVIMHDLIEFNVPNKFSKKKMFYRTKLADPITARRANQIITVSENSKRDIIHFLGVSSEKITVIYNGVDQNKFIKMDLDKAQDILKKRNLPSNFLLYVGTIDHPGKNVMGVISAFEKMKDHGTYKGSLVLAGMPGSGYEFVEDHINNSKWKKEIFTTGYVSDEELVALYSRCDTFCFLSLYEGFGIPPLEALSCGAKVVVSNTSSLPEVVGTVGFTVDPLDENAIISAIEQSAKQDEKISSFDVKQHLNKFVWQNLSKQFERVFQG